MTWWKRFVENGKRPTGNPGTGMPRERVEDQLRRIIELLEKIEERRPVDGKP